MAGFLQLRTQGTGKGAWARSHAGVCQPQTGTVHRAMRYTSSGVSQGPPCCAGGGDPQSLLVSFAWVAVEGTAAQLRFTESQNHRMFEVGRDPCGSSSPTPLPKQGHLQQAAQDLVQPGLEYLQRRTIMGAIRQTFSRSWLCYGYHCWADIKRGFLSALLTH